MSDDAIDFGNPVLVWDGVTPLTPQDHRAGVPVPGLFIQLSDGTRYPFVPTQQDLDADDWEVAK